MKPHYPYIEDFCDDTIYVFSTLGQGPKGDKGDTGEKGDKGESLRPVFADPLEWDQESSYEDMTVVLYQGDSYMSKQAVPAGIDIHNKAYWGQTSKFSAQLANVAGAAATALRRADEAKQDLLNEASARINADNKVNLVIDKIAPSVKVMFLPVEYSDTEVINGDCTVFITDNHVLMIDAGQVSSYTHIKRELENNGISHIDHFILTHYHSDHTGNCQNLVNDGYIDSDTIAYLPRAKTEGVVISDWGNENLARIPLSVCSEIIEPTSATFLSIDGMSVSFFNCDVADIEYYDSFATPKCNNYSICNVVRFGSTKILMTGDIEEEAQLYLSNRGFFQKCDILKVAHHGFGGQNNPEMYLAAAPTYAILSANEYGYQKGTNQDPVRFLNAIGTRVYTACETPIIAYLGKDRYNLYTDKGETTPLAAMNKIMRLYVSKTYSGHHSDGTQKKPFKTLMAAVSHARKMNINNVTITAIDEYVSEEVISVESAIPKIEITGFTFKQFVVKNSNVLLSNSHINGSITRAIIAYDSFLTLSNTIIDGDVRSASSANDGRGLVAYGSVVKISGSEISNKRICIASLEGSVVYASSLKGTNNEYPIACNYASTIGITLNANFESVYKYASESTGNYYGHITNDPNYLIGKLPNNSDLDDYRETGKYKVTSTSAANSIANKPSNASGAFNLYIERFDTGDTGRTIQKFETINWPRDDLSRFGQWMRVYNPDDGSFEGDWSPWYKQF